MPRPSNQVKASHHGPSTQELSQHFADTGYSIRGRSLGISSAQPSRGGKGWKSTGRIQTNKAPHCLLPPV